LFVSFFLTPRTLRDNETDEYRQSVEDLSACLDFFPFFSLFVAVFFWGRVINEIEFYSEQIV
jgi:hypothetical protein